MLLSLRQTHTLGLARRNTTVFSGLPPSLAKIRVCSGNNGVKLWWTTSWSALSAHICFMSACSFAPITVYVMMHASFVCTECVCSRLSKDTYTGSQLLLIRGQTQNIFVLTAGVGACYRKVLATREAQKNRRQTVVLGRPGIVQSSSCSSSHNKSSQGACQLTSHI